MLITQSEAGRLLGVSREAVRKMKHEPFFDLSGKKDMIDTNHPAWINKLASPKKTRKNKSISKGVKRRDEMNKSIKDLSYDNIDYEKPKDKKIDQDEIETPTEWGELAREAKVAEWNDIIYSAEIKKQKAEQEKLKTLEQKKDLANIDLLIHFFSFAENIIQRWYRRPHELSPQLSAFYLAGEEKKAEQLLLKELEGIIKETQKELIKSLEEEGLKISEYN